MKVRKAVITAASPLQRKLPLQTLIDRNGEKKTVLEILIREVKLAGIDEVGVVVCPGDDHTYKQVIGSFSDQINFIYQDEPKGYGDALLRAAAFTQNDPFLHLVGDHIYVEKQRASSTKELIELAEKENCAVSAVQPTRESYITQYGVVGGTRVQGNNEIYTVRDVIEKPTPTEAEQKLVVPGLRAGHYLCFFGMHVLTPEVLNIIKELSEANEGKKISLSDALDILAHREKYLAMEQHALRFDLGVHYGLMKAQLAIALNGKDKDYILSELLQFFVSKDLN